MLLKLKMTLKGISWNAMQGGLSNIYRVIIKPLNSELKKKKKILCMRHAEVLPVGVATLFMNSPRSNSVHVECLK